MEDLEKQFITSYLSILAKEGKEICKEVYVMVGDKDELMMEKAKAFCEFFLSYKLEGVNTEKLVERCQNYLIEMRNYRSIKNTFEKVNLDRKKNGLNNMMLNSI